MIVHDWDECKRCGTTEVESYYMDDVSNAYAVTCKCCGHVSFVDAVIFENQECTEYKSEEEVDGRFLSDAGFPKDIYLKLYKGGYHFIYQLQEASLDDMMGVRKLSPSDVKEIEKILNIKFS